MKRKKVSARMVKSIGWSDNTLEVEYLSGLIHQYHGVSEADFVHCSTGNIDKKVRLIGKTHDFTRIEEL
ncbi:KTSC domain-containing protein [Streptococcus loxodontisalivarius]|uniref:Uncharacterized protein n=1 Tax=Streptococcus loxodontisalivarius TaxID=1349415 RepID=A0ABS2PSK8_9STRE|nr:KTSC domain-containing protein [Streptococcus loxodontisalivarius]MBM7643023.1 hypothetical protein [Streptococcus loxodontisalivarius]